VKHSRQQIIEQLSSVSADLSAAMMEALQQGSECSAMDIIKQINRDVECVWAKLTDMTVTQDSILAFVSRHAVMLELLIGGRFNIPQVALLVPSK
jgi:hypothetical protein